MHCLGHLVLLLPWSAAAFAQTPGILWTQTGQLPLENLGWDVAMLNDVDGDGLGDVAAGSPAHSSSNGAVTLFSGANGAIVWQTLGSTDSGFGTSLACVGDADGDGFDDLVVGAPYDNASNVGTAHLVSGRTGQIVWTRSGSSIFPPAANIHNFGIEVYRVGDINGDGYGDAWVVGIDLVASFGTILSGRNGAILRVHNTTNSRWAPYRACAIGDRDQDGYDDYAYGCPDDNAPSFPWQYFGSVTIASGLTGQPFMIVEGEHVTAAVGAPSFGYSLDAFGDWNQDSVVDLVVGDPSWDYGMGPMFNAGRTRVISGADGSVLATFGTATSGRDQGKRVFALGDVSGDGAGDFGMLGKLITTTAFWTIQVVDGRSGQILQVLWPNPAVNLEWGTAAAGVDLDGDRIPDLVNGVPYTPPVPGLPSNLNGLVFAVDLGFGGVRALARTRGVGCVGPTGSLPQCRILGLPKLGTNVSLVGRALPANAPTVLAFGAPQQLDLSSIGAPSCTAYVNPGFLMGGGTSLGGYARFDFVVPAIPVLQGIALSAQWLAFEAAANPLGIVLSNVADFELQP